jgi:hypothetical protein
MVVFFPSDLLWSIDAFPSRKSVIWLMIAIVAEIPPVVSLTAFLSLPFLFISVSYFRYLLF